MNTFGVVAAGAGPGEVAWLCGAAVFAADNVVRLAAPERVFLVDEAILADVIGAVGDLPAQSLAYVTAHAPKAGGRGLLPAALGVRFRGSDRVQISRRGGAGWPSGA